MFVLHRPAATGALQRDTTLSPDSCSPVGERISPRVHNVDIIYPLHGSLGRHSLSFTPEISLLLLRSGVVCGAPHLRFCDSPQSPMAQAPVLRAPDTCVACIAYLLSCRPRSARASTPPPSLGGYAVSSLAFLCCSPPPEYSPFSLFLSRRGSPCPPPPPPSRDVCNDGVCRYAMVAYVRRCVLMDQSIFPVGGDVWWVIGNLARHVLQGY